ncbi:hypothetical protein NDU88_004955 [Pleurodeles waltl]|uniref:Uncharacterized protein n=1 Tax=Pleurodeles waltl TaxID=8319 RepID=A0AAV7VHQ2_PLEWA|nr:hypothetical protein NDU88_004955 [Pleurodeles waltl]
MVAPRQPSTPGAPPETTRKRNALGIRISGFPTQQRTDVRGGPGRKERRRRTRRKSNDGRINRTPRILKKKEPPTEGKEAQRQEDSATSLVGRGASRCIPPQDLQLDQREPDKEEEKGRNKLMER